MGAMLMSIMIGWDLGPDLVLNEIQGSKKNALLTKFYTISVRFLAPLGMLLVFAGQIYDFFVDPAATDAVKAQTQTIAYAISIAVLVAGLLLAFCKKDKKSAK